MTIQDLIEAGITDQGMLIVRVCSDSGTDDAWTKVVFCGDAEDVNSVEFEEELWFCEYEIIYIYSMEREGADGWCIEVQSGEC